MRVRGTVTVLLLGLVGATGLALAKDKAPDGRALFREYCKPCHEQGSANGEYTPMTLIQEQWQRFFDEKYVRTHQGVVDEKHEGKAVTDVITPEMLKQIEKFAIDHAADSEHPMTCG
jgi:hypothetical protein